MSSKRPCASHVPSALYLRLRPRSLTNDQLVKFQELTSKQLEGVDIGLPTLVVIGDQSSGKSSILNAMLRAIGSEARLPTADKICTRQPTLLVLAKNESSRTFIGKEEVKGGAAAIKAAIDQRCPRIQASLGLNIAPCPTWDQLFRSL